MKKLGKLKLKNAVLMNENEMKRVVGGYDGGYGGSSCSCTGNGCAGSCPDRVEGDFYSGYTLVPQSCVGEIIWDSTGTIGTEICVCK